MSGVGRVLVAVYGLLALAALGRSIFQIIDRFDAAPVAYTLSAIAALVYVVATLALALRWERVAWATILFELAGVLIIGTLTTIWPDIIGEGAGDPFGRSATVWSTFGAGYVFIPLVVPILGIVWLVRARRHAARAVEPAATIQS